MSADEVRLNFRTRQVTVVGKPLVTLVHDDATLTCKRLIGENDAAGRLKVAVCEGDVKLVRVGRVVTCDRATYDRGAGRVVCTGHTLLKDPGGTEASAATLTYDLQSDEVILGGGGPVHRAGLRDRRRDAVAQGDRGPGARGLAAPAGTPPPGRREARGHPVTGSLLLRAEGLVKSYRRRRVVDGVTFHVAPGEVVGLLGPNGAGKSTSFNMVVGLVTPDAGHGAAGRPGPHLAAHAPAGAARGRLPAAGGLHLPQAHGAPELHRRAGGARGGPQGAARRGPTRCWPSTGWRRWPTALGETLSGGERRRAEVARSLLSNPRFILFDEPFAGVDPIAVGELQRLIGGLRDRDIGVLITDHNVRETLGICGRAYILSAGTILEAGTPAEIAGSSQARAVYLGEKFRLDDASPRA